MTDAPPNLPEYLNVALDVIQREALHAPRVNWRDVRAQAAVLASTAEAPAGTYAGIEFALRALGDRHSFLKRPEQLHGRTLGGFGLKYEHGVIARVYHDSPAARAGLRVGDRLRTVNGLPVGPGVNVEMPREGNVTLHVTSIETGEAREVHLERAPFNLNRVPRARLLSGRIGWLDLPDHGGNGTLPDGRRYQDVVQGLIAELLQAGARGWIVDLQLNEGGNMHPMLAGVGPLAGDGVLGAFVRDDARWAWSYHGGEARVEDTVTSRVTGTVVPALPDVPVAVLTSPLTSSSGELIAVSFKGHPHTRFFGEATQGLTSSNNLYRLSDGAELWLTTTRAADRLGREYHGHLDPDEEVRVTWALVGTDEDPALRVASAWLRDELGQRNVEVLGEGHAGARC